MVCLFYGSCVNSVACNDDFAVHAVCNAAFFEDNAADLSSFVPLNAEEFGIHQNVSAGISGCHCHGFFKFRSADAVAVGPLLVSAVAAVGRDKTVAVDVIFVHFVSVEFESGEFFQFVETVDNGGGIVNRQSDFPFLFQD